MVKVYTDKQMIAKDGYVYKDCTMLYFNNHTYFDVDFKKYDYIFKTIEKYYTIDYDRKVLTNKFGRAGFFMLSTGMRNLFNYIALCEDKEDTKTVLDLSNMGPNVQQFLYRFANYYERPYYCYSFNICISHDFKDVENVQKIEDTTFRQMLEIPGDDIRFWLDGKEYNNVDYFAEFKRTMNRFLEAQGREVYEI